jgi:hypothetical protein
MPDEGKNLGATPSRVVVSGRQIAWVFLAGTGFILLGFSLEEFGPPLGDWIDSFRAVVHRQEQTPAVHSSDAPHSLTFFKVVVLLLKEVGVAFMVAAIIGWAIEKHAREREGQLHDEMRRNLVDDAIFAIYGFRHHREFINAVVETNLHTAVVREGMEMIYTLRDLTDTEVELLQASDAQDTRHRFVILEMQYKYRLKNVGPRKESICIPYSLPVRQGLGAQKIAEVSYLCIDDQPRPKTFIDGGISVKQDHDERSYKWEWSLDSNEHVSVDLHARCVKERSDNECWGCMFPTMGDVELELTVLEGLNFGVREISNADLLPVQRAPSSVSKSWIMRGSMLKHNSIVFWWRTPEDEGNEEPAPEKGVPAKAAAFSPNIVLEPEPSKRKLRSYIRSLIGR